MGQTSNRVIDKFQGHFGLIGRNSNETLISFHFNTKDHNGLEDIEIFILDFEQVTPKHLPRLLFVLHIFRISYYSHLFNLC